MPRQRCRICLEARNYQAASTHDTANHRAGRPVQQRGAQQQGNYSVLLLQQPDEQNAFHYGEGNNTVHSVAAPSDHFYHEGVGQNLSDDQYYQQYYNSEEQAAYDNYESASIEELQSVDYNL